MTSTVRSSSFCS